MHIMGGICCVAPKHAVCTSGEIPKLKRLPAASEIASIGAVELKDFPDQKTTLEPVKYLDVSGFTFGDVVPGITTVYSTHIWASYMQVENLPSIRGLFDRIAKVPFYQVSKIFCLPFIDENPSDLRTIYTALHYAAQHCKETERKTCFVTFDYPLYIKAKQILCNTKDKNLENVVPCLGGFHLLMSYSKAIGTIMEGSGIFELFCTVFAQNSVDKMLLCTAYSRAIRAHMLAMNAIGEIIAEFAESSENIESHKNIEHIKESRPLEAPPSFIRESCSNATDLVELTENADEDEEDDEDESFDYISEIELEKRNAKRLAYERFKRSIFGLEDTDSEEEEGEEDQIEDHAVEETVEVSRTSNVDEPSTSQISPLKKGRKRQI
ncbi:hypothetical protein JTB14_012864 [Gonioctena quinquepunctata]|nr:hypothetical protein JTB14_012864 [Gonioctena quinquepunctata]